MAIERPQTIWYPSTPAVLMTVFVSLLSTPRALAGKYGQFALPDAYENGSSLAYYGSENPWNRRMFSARSADRFYKRRGQRQLLAILDGQPEQAVLWCRRRLDENPADAESLFTLTIAYCQLDQPRQAWITARRAMAAGLPLARYLAGPRPLLRPLTGSDDFQHYLAAHPVRLLHGPMLGSVTDRSARFWIRTRDAASVTIRLRKPGRKTVVAHGTCRTRPANDYTGVATVEGLEPSTRYDYDTLVADRPVATARPHTFRTYPPAGRPAEVRIVFGGGAGFTPRHESMWDRIASFRPDALLLLGDNVYIDLPETPGPLHRYTYYRRQSRPEFRRLVDRTSVYAIWDDHDAAIDDVWLGPYLDRPAWKRAQWKLFRQNWVNPAYGDPTRLGCWFHFSIADIDFFLLDCRFYRTNPFGDHPTMLGSVQKAWLFDQLKRSRATFKVVVSSVPWAPGAKPGSRDTWDGFPQERVEIFQWLDQHGVEGVFLLSADRHRSDAWRIKRTGTYPLYDLMSSRLTNVHTHETMPGALFAYNQKCSFGMLDFDTTRPDPRVVYQIVSIDGQIIHTLPIHRSQLARPPIPAKRP